MHPPVVPAWAIKEGAAVSQDMGRGLSKISHYATVEYMPDPVFIGMSVWHGMGVTHDSDRGRFMVQRAFDTWFEQQTAHKKLEITAAFNGPPPTQI